MEFVLRDSVHEDHDETWRMYSSLQGCYVCLGCIVEILENKNLLTLQKTPALTELLRLLSHQSQDILQLFMQEERIVWHIVSILFGNNTVLERFYIYTHIYVYTQRMAVLHGYVIHMYFTRGLKS